MAQHRSVLEKVVLQTILRVIWDFMFQFVASDVVLRKKLHICHRTIRSGYYGSIEPLELPDFAWEDLRFCVLYVRIVVNP